MKTLTFDGVGRIHIPKEIRKLILGVEDTEGMALNLYLYGNRIIMEVPGDHDEQKQPDFLKRAIEFKKHCIETADCNLCELHDNKHRRCKVACGAPTDWEVEDEE